MLFRSERPAAGPSQPAALKEKAADPKPITADPIPPASPKEKAANLEASAVDQVLQPSALKEKDEATAQPSAPLIPSKDDHVSHSS